MDTSPFSIDANQPHMYGFRLFYKVSGETLAKDEVVQLVVRLPFCLYIPPCRYTFIYPGTDKLIGLVPEKVWTEQSEGSIEMKDELVMPDKTVYLSNAQIITDWIGASGASVQGLKGQNMEFDKDPTGYFRFTRLTAEFDWEVPNGFDPYGNDDERQNGIVEQLSSWTLDLANYIIDLYRTVTGDGYIKRLSHIVIDDLRIGIPDNCSIRKQERFTGDKFTYKCGYHPFFFTAHGIRPAVVNKPGVIIDTFRKSLERELPPETYHLLELNAEVALDQRDVKIAVIESFTSLEVYVEQFYYQKLSSKMSATDIDCFLTSGDNWRLKVRLKEILNKNGLKSVAEVDNKLWQNWLKAHDKRNDLIHHNIEPSLEEAKEIADLNKAVIRLLKTL